ncbi:EAL domain-containing protein [Sulfurimonas sp. SAG-AH-194-I05]|nr:GGDEF and EAL domain-containing protein [Sulfurimonas sp. SAG-AH-194-I05]MDF1874619.1 EAL domain-containing protein [Sulfurimonas sp. SAG-AH-194-I05]
MLKQKNRKKLEFDPQKLLDDMVTFVAVLDTAGTIIFVNNTPLIAAGITLKDIVGIKFWDASWWAYSQDAIDAIQNDSQSCAAGNSLLHEIQLATADGTLIWIEYSMHPIFDDEGNVEYLVPEGRDITEKKEQQFQMQRLAHYDILTGLPNRTLFADRFKIALAHANRNETLLAVCFVDIDHFKPINDNYGHEEGDQLLVEIAQRLDSCIRREDTVSRMGGDEFTMLLGVHSQKECEDLVKRILTTLSKPYCLSRNTHSITASCGITLYPYDDADADVLTRHADQAMYEAKISGKNKFIFFDAKKEHSTQIYADFLDTISRAIASNEMGLYYQPKINMKTGYIYGVEALIRWNHPTKGLQSPIEFLPYIQKTVVMIELGKWVISQALHQLNLWYKEKKQWRMSINIDAYHFTNNDFCSALENALSQYANPLGKFLEIEILETEDFSDLNSVSSRITTCQSLGVHFALDDFGTGYCSLLYLKKLPINCLKIDQSFVKDILTDKKDRSLINGIIALSRAFDVDIIAEGVETLEDGIALLELGCVNAQGYYIAKPMPILEFLVWSKKYTPEKQWKKVIEIQG